MNSKHLPLESLQGERLIYSLYYWERNLISVEDHQVKDGKSRVLQGGYAVESFGIEGCF